MHGWRARIGLLVPSINTTMETELWRLVPAGVTVHTARFSGKREGTPDALRGMEDESKGAAAQVAMTEPGVSIYACTSGSFFEGVGWDKRIADELSAVTGSPVVTTSGAMLAALKAAGVRKVDVVTPYVQLTNERLKQFLEASGITVTKLGTFDMLDMFNHAKIQPSEIYAKVKETATSDSDAVFVACTQLRALEVVDMLEADLGKPVYSAVQVSAWQAFDILGIDPHVSDCGSLLRDMAKSHATERLRKSV